MRISVTAVAVLTLGLAACGSAAAESEGDPAVVHTDAGAVRGTVTDEARTFEGVPFASPPTGEARWEAPQPAEPWDDVRDATKPGAACTQPQDQPIAIENNAEDCLYLNVTTPADASQDAELPVVVAIHGGSFVYGDGASQQAQRMASQGEAIVVTPNYRLGAFGFLAHPEMDDFNAGLADQRAALEWVQNNAAAFGGDADNVTAMGQSGGGYSVCAQLSAPDSADLIDKAILQSSDCLSEENTTTPEEAQKAGQELVESVGCDDLECLRGKEAEEILEASDSGHEAFRPTHGTADLPLSPGEALPSGEFHQVPVLTGSVSDEAVGPIAGEELASGEPLTAEDYEQRVTAEFGDRAPEVLAEYPVDDYETPSNALSAVNTDSSWSTPMHQLRTALAEYVPVHAYEVNEDNSPWFKIGEPSFTVGTDHMVDLAYLFDMEVFESRDDAHDKLATEMVDSWAAFARQGEPADDWAEFNSDGYVQGLSTDHVGQIDFVADRHVEFWS